ncbi:MAG TPA: 5'-methylthioadenosine/S-adenosylhomocysteine nucleosidase [Myxococcota bacterium]|nr:5'-methylthioadenosine/S-adenosylhomocysteine nucleosidase [Myxococcota bacterium]
MTAPPTARRIALLAPMRSELRPLVRALSLRREAAEGPERFVGARGALEIVATTAGIGPAAAARATERLLDARAADHLVVVGIAGAIGPTVGIGDLVVPQLVLDVSSGIARRPAPLGDATPRGTLATSERLVVDPAEIARLERQGVVAIDMETAAIASVCERRGCPWSVFRAISDRADDGSTDPAVLALAGPDGGGDLRAVARYVLAKPWRVAMLVRLARGTRLATRVAADAAIRALTQGSTPGSPR